MPICEECNAAGLDHESIAYQCKTNPFWTGRILCNFDLLGTLHYNLSEWYLKKLAEGYKRFIIMTPRDHLKTTLFGISLMIQTWLKDPEERILYMMARSDNAEEKLSAVKSVITRGGSDAFAHFFPDRVIDPAELDKWRSDAIQLPRVGIYPDPTIKAVGLTSSITGGHYTKQLFDDLIDEKICASPSEQEKAVGFIRRAGPLFVDLENNVRIIIGTRWPGQFYDWLLDEYDARDDYAKAIIGCFVDHRYRDFMAEIGKTVDAEDGDPIWPERFSKEILEKQRTECGEFDFAHQWLNIPSDESMRRFNKEDFQQYVWNADRTVVTFNWHKEAIDVKLSDLYITMMVDPSTGEGLASDQSAITVCGFHRYTGAIFILEDWDGRVLPHGLISRIITTAQRWNPSVVGIEDVSFQKTLKHFLRQEMIQQGVHFTIRPMKTGNVSKKGRIVDGLQPFAKNHQLHVTRENHRLVRELLNLRIVNNRLVGRSPNLADSLAYHVEFWRKASLNQPKEEIPFVDNREQRRPKPAYGLECST